HGSSGPQLAHAGIDDRNTGAAALPGVQQRRLRGRPGKAVKTWIEVGVGSLREVMQQVPRKLPPAQLPQTTINIGITARAAPCLQRARDAPRRDLTEVQVR